MNETRNDIYQFDDAEIAEHPIVQRMIRDAVAARDAEIRAALLSEANKPGSDRTMHVEYEDGVHYYTTPREDVEYYLELIGLAEQEDA